MIKCTKRILINKEVQNINNINEIISLTEMIRKVHK